MSLTEQDIQFIKDHLGEWLAEQSLGKPPVVYEIELRERMVRVEEGIRHNQEAIQALHRADGQTLRAGRQALGRDAAQHG